ncbi:hypothetical protein LEM8419_00867 [Neolewinella maritima]|uniref:Tetratricopeptide repeat protein n=1 Tax=Neolewinella maritima TaxID=1383882 RepID=A0ABM9AYP0_9BACT|nr:hypothetical protein [Neolewinella maritima]CAH0999567.1 hypothetical protein LEM8419_00867 [Neolewinella maritima]
MRRLHLLVLLLWSACPYAQSTAVDWFLDYNPQVTAAEDALLRRDPHTALEYYQLAFAVPADPHTVDLYNAALAARAADRPDLLRLYLGELVQLGIPVTYVDRHRTELDHPRLDWYSLRGELLRYKTDYQRSFNVELADCYERVAYRDVVIRTAEPPGAVRQVQDSLNMVGLTDCIATHGFPGQRHVRRYDPMEENYPYYLPLLHELERVNSTGDDRFGCLPLLEYLARRGIIETETYMDLLSTQHANLGGPGGYGTTSVVLLQDGTNDLYRIVYPPATVADYEDRRRQVGVRSFRKRTELLINLHTGALGDFPYRIPRRHKLVAYPLEVADVLQLERVGVVEATR